MYANAPTCRCTAATNDGKLECVEFLQHTAYASKYIHSKKRLQRHCVEDLLELHRREINHEEIFNSH